MQKLNKIIIITLITISVISLLLPLTAFAENGTIQIQIQGAGIGDNLKTSAYTFQKSWEWNDTFALGDRFVKQVDGITSGEILNVCILKLQEKREDCSSGIFDNNGIVNINIDLE